MNCFKEKRNLNPINFNPISKFPSFHYSILYEYFYMHTSILVMIRFLVLYRSSKHHMLVSETGYDEPEKRLQSDHTVMIIWLETRQYQYQYQVSVRYYAHNRTRHHKTTPIKLHPIPLTSNMTLTSLLGWNGRQRSSNVNSLEVFQDKRWWQNESRESHYSPLDWYLPFT